MEENNKEVTEKKNEDEKAISNVAEFVFLQNKGSKNKKEIEEEIEYGYKKLMIKIDEKLKVFTQSNIEPSIINRLTSKVKRDARKNFFNAVLDIDINEIDLLVNNVAIESINPITKIEYDEKNPLEIIEPNEGMILNYLRNEKEVTFKDNVLMDFLNDKDAVKYFNQKGIDFKFENSEDLRLRCSKDEQEEEERIDVLSDSFGEVAKTGNKEEMKKYFSLEYGTDAVITYFSEKCNIIQELDNKSLRESFGYALEHLDKDESFQEDQWTMAKKIIMFKNILTYEGEYDEEIENWKKTIQEKEPELTSIIIENAEFLKDIETTDEFIYMDITSQTLPKEKEAFLDRLKVKCKEHYNKIDENKNINSTKIEKTDTKELTDLYSNKENENENENEVIPLEIKQKNLDKTLKQFIDKKGIKKYLNFIGFNIKNRDKQTQNLFASNLIKSLSEERNMIDFEQGDISSKIQDLFVTCIEDGISEKECIEKIPEINLGISKEVLKQLIKNQNNNYESKKLNSITLLENNIRQNQKSQTKNGIFEVGDVHDITGDISIVPNKEPKTKSFFDDER